MTTSFGIVRDETGIIVDHGYGIQNVVPWLKKHDVKEVIILQTHYHLDHIAGLPLNGFLFQKHIPVRGIWSARTELMDATWAHCFNDIHWPIRPEALGIEAPPRYTAWHNQPRFIEACHLDHPGGSVGYRISHPRGDIVIATDHEAGVSKESDAVFAEFIDGAALLVADVQYRQSEYEGAVGIGTGAPMSRSGWGHSTPERIADVLARCKKPPSVRVTHHDPMRETQDLGRFSIELGAALGSDPCCLLDGEEVVV